jgi:hypothetical protein
MTKMIRGVAVEQRLCACPCKKPFWVQLGSTQTVWSQYCREDFVWGSAPSPATNIDGLHGPRGRPVLIAPEGLLTRNQLAAKLGVSRFSINNWMKRGIIPYITNFSGSKFYRLDSVKAALNARADAIGQTRQAFRP